MTSADLDRRLSHVIIKIDRLLNENASDDDVMKPFVEKSYIAFFWYEEYVVEDGKITLDTVIRLHM